jgi:signal transduction histidine kinase
VASDGLADRPVLAARYADEVRALLVSRLRVCCWLAIVLVPVFIGLDSVLHPQLVGRFLVIRAAMTATSLLVLAALQTELGARHVLALSFVNFVATGLGIVLMTVFNGGGSSTYYAGLNLVMLAAAVLMPWEVATSVSCCLTLITAYAATCLFSSNIPDPRVFISNVFFLVSTAMIMIVSHRVAAAARGREFLQRVALEEAGQHRDHFLANVTHELRTPLAAILGFCEMLSDYMPDASDQQRTWLARIRDNACTLYRLIVQILDFSKIDAGAMELARERFGLDAVVEKVASDMRAIGGADGVDV